MVPSEERRAMALQLAVSWGAGWNNSSPKPETVVSAAQQFENYLKGIK